MRRLSFLESPLLLTHNALKMAIVFRATWVVIAAMTVSCPKILVAADPVAEQFFETTIRPILANHCQECHGAKKQESALRLDSRAAIFKGGDSGPAVGLETPDKSLILEVVRYHGDLQMPPRGKLAESQIEALELWVKNGAAWPADNPASDNQRAEQHRRHWAFQPVANPPLPAVDNQGWVKTPVDQFVLARLESEHLTPSPPADRRTLIRRVTYDLTGLPPTPEEVDAFVNDQASDAYSRLVDRLLASPAYGEQWGRHWLDVARYADTKGYVYAREERFWVHAWAYRDWVVDAVNRDLPYNQFLFQQIAADQLDSVDRTSLAAMGFLTLGRRFLGVTHDVIDDRIDVVMRGTMGLTVACARCHDHKYDPIPTADYYSLYGVFQNSIEKMVQISDSPVRDAAYLAFEEELLKRKQKLHDTLLMRRNEASARVRARVGDYLVAQTELSKYPEEGFDQIYLPTDIFPMFVRRWEAFLALETRKEDPVFRPWRMFAALKPDEFQDKASAVLDDLKMAPQRVNPVVWTILETPPASMRELAERYGGLFQQIEGAWQAACKVASETGESLPPALGTPEVLALRNVLYGPNAPCVVPDEPIVAIELFVDQNVCNELWGLQGEVDRWLVQSPQSPPHALTLVERAFPRPSRIFRRGNPANRGPEVTRHFVSAVAGPNPPPFQNGSGRLELAQAIVDPSNPLTSRVWVNRVWQHHFGVGLVKTPSDFGVRAEPPSHPELLDWLATQFVKRGWSTKHLHRMILLSNTYQQRSDGLDDFVLREKVKELDAENRLLSRMNPKRLTFEEFRDSLLAVAGRLDRQMGGKAADLFTASGTAHRRRTLYGLVDRQFLPAVLRTFDFANPDLHIPSRSETTVPQQGLFALNHPFVAQQSRAAVDRVASQQPNGRNESVKRLYQTVYQRDPTREQLAIATAFLDLPDANAAAAPTTEQLAWQYGYGELDPDARQLKTFQALPHFTGNAWQGGEQWPDTALGWTQLTATGGHPGNDVKHASVRRWVAPRAGTFSIASTPSHEVATGNGIRCWIFGSRSGLLATCTLKNERKPLDVESVVLQKGDTLDFVVDVNGELNNDQHEWVPIITEVLTEEGTPSGGRWEATRDFSGPAKSLLNRWEQLAQVLLISNEMMFVD